MTRPQIIRADTLDLQSQAAPSAKDHSRQPVHPAPLGIGPAGPHQAAAVRHVVEEQTAEQEHLQEAFVGDHTLREEPELDTKSLTNGEHSVQQQLRDDQAVQQNGSLQTSTEDGGSTQRATEDGVDEDQMDKISSSPSIDDGDTMVLLDDSNSYWWLVRVVKDSSIGYLPAEHIETPTERLARLNKHRNIDLSATMLGDNPEKSKNPLKKAMKRRGAKTVQFTAPTYYEAAERDYSTDEETGEELVNGSIVSDGIHAQSQQLADHDQSAVVAPLQIKSVGADGKPGVDAQDGSRDSSGSLVDKPRTSDELLRQQDAPAGKLRNGVIRNTDSFFKDDSTETRKITLTPNLLRDDSSTSSVRSSDSRERTAANVDPIDKPGASLESKDDRKRKEKRPGMFSGLFKKKDKRARTPDEHVDGVKRAKEATLTTQRTELIKERPQRLPNIDKLSRPPSDEFANWRPRSSDSAPELPELEVSALSEPIDALLIPSVAEPLPSGTGRSELLGGNLHEDSFGARTLSQSNQTHHNELPMEVKNDGGILAPVTRILGSDTTSEQTKDAKQRVELHDFGAPPEAEPIADQFTGELREDDEATPTQLSALNNRFSELSFEVFSAEGSSGINTRTTTADVESGEGTHAFPTSPLFSSLDLVEMPEANGPESEDSTRSPSRSANTTPTALATPTVSPTWSDASLRAYLDDNDIRDMLIVINDKTDVVPAPPDHPIMAGLFQEESWKLASLSTRLDGMLGDWLARKARARAK